MPHRCVHASARLSRNSWIPCSTHAAGDIVKIVSAGALPFYGPGVIRQHELYSWSGIGTRRWGCGSGWGGFFSEGGGSSISPYTEYFFDWPLVRHRSSPSVEALRVFLRLLSTSAVGLKFVELENMYVKTQQIFGFMNPTVIWLSVHVFKAF